MRIATWNVNSIRTRLDRVTQWLQAHSDVDVLCLQETKVEDSKFPAAAFTERGYFPYVFGQKSYNGVALIARAPLEDLCCGFGAVLPEGEAWDAQKRAIAAIARGIRLVNLYVPNGAAVGSEKYEYKLGWLATLKDYLQALMARDSRNGLPPALLVCGDFNVAVADIDIHDPSDRASQVMATDAERAALQAVLDLGLHDAFRKFTPDPGHYTWWDYRAGSFRRNRGWRIDYHFLSSALYDRAIACEIDIEPRKLDQPSDHVPVIVTLRNAGDG